MGKGKGKGNSEQPAGAPLWMVTYGDLMSLLLTFFVLLVSFSSIQEVEFQKAMGSLKGALGVLTSRPSVIQVAAVKPGPINRIPLKVKEEFIELREVVEMMKLDKDVKLSATSSGFSVRISSPLLFELGKADLKPEMFHLLDLVLRLASDWPNDIRVEGHTDDLPIRTAQFPSNWELSTGRALSVLKYAADRVGIMPQRLSAVGYGEFRPIVPNDSETNRRSNRRVEILIEHREQEDRSLVEFAERLGEGSR